MFRRAVLVGLVVGSLAVPAFLGAAAAAPRGKPAFCSAMLGYSGYLYKYKSKRSETTAFFTKMERSAPASLKADVRRIFNTAKAYAVKPDIDTLLTKATIASQARVARYRNTNC